MACLPYLPGPLPDSSQIATRNTELLPEAKPLSAARGVGERARQLKGLETG